MATKKLQIVGSLGSNVEIDATLRETGKAADAKAVSDAIESLKDTYIGDDTVSNQINTAINELSTDVAYIDPTDNESITTEIESAKEQITVQPYKIISVAHRGGMPTEAPENTLIGYAKAAEMGFDYCEMDIRFTSDGVPVMLHDATINRTARNSDGSTVTETINIADITYEQSQQYVFCGEASYGLYDTYPNVRIPTLEESIALCRSVGIKPWFDMYFTPTTENITAIFAILDKYGMRDSVVWGSSTYNDVYFIKNYYAKANIGTRSSTYGNTTSMLSGLANLSTGQNKVFVNVHLESMAEYSPLLRKNGYEVMYVTPTKENFISVYSYVTAVMSEDYLASEYVIEHLLNGGTSAGGTMGDIEDDNSGGDSNDGTEDSGISEPVPTLLNLNRTLGTQWYDEMRYLNPAKIDSMNMDSGEECAISVLGQNYITVTENGSGGTGVAFPFVIYNTFITDKDRRGNTYNLTWDATGSTNTRFRLMMISNGNLQTAYLDDRTGTNASATIEISEDGLAVTVNGSAYTFTESVNYLAFHFGSATGTTTRYKNVVLLSDDEPIGDQTEPTLSSVSATYTGGEVTEGTALTSLTGITVTATYSDGSTTNVIDYTLSGTIGVGSNIITVTYEGLMSTFTVVGIAKELVDSLLVLNNRTLATDYSNAWTDNTMYINPAKNDSTNNPNGNACGITNLTENSITVTEPGDGDGRGVSYPFSTESMAGKTYLLTWNATGTTNARFRLQIPTSSITLAPLDYKNGTTTSATISISADRKTVTVDGTPYTRTDGSVIAWIAFFFGAATGKTVNYAGVSLVEAE